MNQSYLGIGFLGLTFGLGSCAGSVTEQQNQSPNIIYILADDLGYGELGCYGQYYLPACTVDKPRFAEMTNGGKGEMYGATGP